MLVSTCVALRYFIALYNVVLTGLLADELVGGESSHCPQLLCSNLIQPVPLGAVKYRKELQTRAKTDADCHLNAASSAKIQTRTLLSRHGYRETSSRAGCRR